MQNTTQRQNHFWERGCQYYVAGRHAVTAGLNPISGNLLHHAIECMLKGAMVKTRTLQELKKLGHGLPQLWQAFKFDVGDPALSKFDAAVVALDNYEDLRYPDDALKNGMESVIISHRLQAGSSRFPPLPPGLPAEVAAQINQVRANLPQVRRYDLCLQDVDELAEAIFRASGRKPVEFFGGMNPAAKQALADGNMAKGLRG
ncbi:hypothetical protein ACVINW_004184 [Bradyrhizobium sp. USDA 4461]